VENAVFFLSHSLIRILASSKVVKYVDGPSFPDILSVFGIENVSDIVISFNFLTIIDNYSQFL